MSKLASLAKQRALKKANVLSQQNQNLISDDSEIQEKPSFKSTPPLHSSSPSSPELSRLDILRAKHDDSNTTEVIPNSTTDQIATSKPSALQKLASRSLANKTITPNTKGGLSSLLSRPGPNKTSNSLTPRPSSLIQRNLKGQSKKITPDETSTEPAIPICIFPDIDYQTHFENNIESTSLASQILFQQHTLSFLTNLMDLQSNDEDIYDLFEEESYKESLFSNFLYPLEISPKIKNSFSQPSPDDIVLTAQSQAKGFTDDSSSLHKPMASLKLEPTTAPLKYNVIEEIKKQKQQKPVVGFVVIGHVDAGKSTLMGRLLVDCGVVSKYQVSKYERDSKEIGKPSFALAWIMDKTPEERSRGITVDVSSSIFETKTHRFTVLDAPGHRDFVPKMIEGSSRADIALLVVDSSANAFEAGFFNDGQTREHAIVARSLGIEQIIVAVNKMDTHNWSLARFQSIEDQLSPFLQKIGFKTESVTFIPCAGLTGDNVVKRSKVPELVSWYDGNSIVEELESQKLPERDYKAPFRMRAVEVEELTHSTQISVAGRIDYGTVQIGQTLSVIPSKTKAVVASIVDYNGSKDPLPWAKAGDYVELFLTNIDVENIRGGDILCSVESPVGFADKFTAKLNIFETNKPILQGNSMIMHFGGSQVEVNITKLIALYNKAGTVTKRSPKLLKGGQIGLVQISVRNKSIPIEKFKDNRDLGRIILRREGYTLAVGIVEDILVPEPKSEAKPGK